MQQHAALEEIILPIVEGLGFTWVGLQYFPQGRHSILRLYVDKPGGIVIEDCEKVSRQVNAALEIENPLKGDYTLEVSSPGLDRLLFSPEQCREQVGKLVTVRLIAPIAGKRNFKGRLLSVEGEKICILADQGAVTLSFREISEARLAPEW